MSGFAPQNLEQWLDELSEMKAVSLGAVIQELNRLTASDETSVQQLANAIMKDPSLTGKVLKAANSAAFNPQEIPVSTISRAIMHVGFDTIRALSVGALLAEQLLGPDASEQLVARIAQAVTAATQARKLCRGLKSELREEVFVASLLYHMGELLVWSYPHPIVDKATRVYVETGDLREAEKVLGVRFRELTRGLVTHWRLGAVLEEALDNPVSKAALAVRAGHEIAEALARGPGHPSVKKAVEKAARDLELEIKTVRAGVSEAVKEAETLGQTYGDKRLTALLSGQTQAHRRADGEQEGVPATHGNGPDSALQLAILQDIMQAMATGISSTELFRMILDGLHRAVGLERVCLALLNPQRNSLSARMAVGEGTEKWVQAFRFTYSRRRNNFWYEVMQTHGVVWLGHPDYVRLQHLAPDALVNLTRARQCLLGGLLTQGREIGVLYADRGTAGARLMEDHRAGFRYFVQQANLCLNMLAQKR
ncbi:MAG: HDOD domain-containing protein [Gammaproteobacteria bacterium]|nr:MAG: HDOD domain-containing protein [Gammaproteobacteria bacterium]